MTLITDLRVFDIRFPTSQSLDGSDAMNPVSYTHLTLPTILRV